VVESSKDKTCHAPTLVVHFVTMTSLDSLPYEAQGPKANVTTAVPGGRAGRQGIVRPTFIAGAMIFGAWIIEGKI
jgi:hypothetical protein